MQIISVKRGRFRTGERAAIWLAFALALTLHIFFLLVPISGQDQPTEDRQRSLEIRLTTLEKQTPAEPLPEPETPTEPLQPSVEQAPEIPPPPTQDLTEKLAESPIANDLPAPPARDQAADLDSLSEAQKKSLTSTILARQYITEESAADRLFGKPLSQESNDFQKDFHYPLRPDLMAMLNQPLPDLPFEYTPGLVYFAYDPGLKGELQRFWDVITPEFGWRTKYGTEVKCALILVIVGCVWK